MKKAPYITRLQNENKKLKAQLALHESRYSFVPGITAIDWTKEDANWLHNVFNQEPGKKLRCLMNNIERHLSFWAIRETNPIKKREYAQKAIGMSLALNHLSFRAEHGRHVEGIDSIESEFLVRGPGEINPDELEKKMVEMAQRPRMGSTRMMGT